jgi:hypothetical protein
MRLSFLDYLAAVKGLDKRLAHQRIISLLELVNLVEVAKRPLGGYSGGCGNGSGLPRRWVVGVMAASYLRVLTCSPGIWHPYILYLDFMGRLPAAANAGIPWFYAGLTLVLIAVSVVGRLRQIKI